MYRITKRMEIAGAHQLRLNYDSKCENLHGHNWIINVVCEVDNESDLTNGMVVDFTHIKRAVQDKFDHKYLNDIAPFDEINPTAENMARYICETVPHCVYVSVQESEGNIAEYIKEDISDGCQ